VTTLNYDVTHGSHFSSEQPRLKLRRSGVLKIRLSGSREPFEESTTMKVRKFLSGLVAGLCCFSSICFGQDNIKALRQIAEHGDAEAQYLLGVCYDRGGGVPQDYNEAVRWYRLAAEQGFVPACCSIGVCYARGEGVAKNYRVAAEWLHIAAEKGVAEAQMYLGLCFSSDRDFPKDYVQAYAWYKLAANQKADGANSFLVALEAKMTPEQVSKGDIKANAFSSSISRNERIPMSIPSSNVDMPDKEEAPLEHDQSMNVKAIAAIITTVILMTLAYFFVR